MLKNWGDLDVAGRFLHVRRTHWKGRDFVMKSRRKGKSATRKVDIGDQVLAVLAQLRRDRFPDGIVPPEEPIFRTPGGARIDPNHFRTRIWAPTLAGTGLSYRKPYAFRHTYATLLLSQGQSIKYVQEQLGHASATMTLDVYAGWLPTERQESPRRFEEQLATARANAMLTEQPGPAGKNQDEAGMGPEPKSPLGLTKQNNRGRARKKA
jgi:integrase